MKCCSCDRILGRYYPHTGLVDLNSTRLNYISPFKIRRYCLGTNVDHPHSYMIIQRQFVTPFSGPVVVENYDHNNVASSLCRLQYSEALQLFPAIRYVIDFSEANSIITRASVNTNVEHVSPLSANNNNFTVSNSTDSALPVQPSVETDSLNTHSTIQPNFDDVDIELDRILNEMIDANDDFLNF